MRLLFGALREAGYEWRPQTPDRLLKFRREASPFRPLVQLFGLGLPVDLETLSADGVGNSLLQLLEKNELVREWRPKGAASSTASVQLKSAMAVSRSGDVFIVHDHWPPEPDHVSSGDGYVHFAAESAWLADAIQRDLEGFIGKRVLDLGCSSGALLFEAAGVASEALGLDISRRAIAWARQSALAQGMRNLRFEVAAVGTPEADSMAGAEPWDVVVMNPPMVVPAKDAGYAHRDGGRLGIELPLKFLDYSRRHLRPGGEVLMLATNPIVEGRPRFFEELGRGHWEFIQKRCLHSHFNQEVARKQGYGELGIERIELWFLNLKAI